MKILQKKISNCWECPYLQFESSVLGKSLWVCSNDDGEVDVIIDDEDYKDPKSVPIPNECPLPNI